MDREALHADVPVPERVRPPGVVVVGLVWGLGWGHWWW